MLKSVDVSGKLQIKRGQSVAVLNPPPGLVLPGVMTAASAAAADAVAAFVVQQEDLGSVEQAVAAADFTACVRARRSGSPTSTTPDDHRTTYQ